jgi:acetaldehyde dehydrogenase/alcohol dehydrogenase
MPMIEDMKDLMTAAYYGTSLADVRGRRSGQATTERVPSPAV